jgi:uncharacterized protein YdhG (YjbR/CyaY superfamily)
MPSSHDAYIAQAPEDLRPLLVRLRTQLAQVLPDAEEIVLVKKLALASKRDQG